MIAFGIDIGGSGIKGAPVNLTEGALIEDRFRIPTPEKSTPKNVAKMVSQLFDHFDVPGDMPIGIALPAPIVHGKVTLMANLHKSWVGVNAAELFSKELGREVTVVNDADAAGYGEAEYGAAKGIPGSILVTTLGTGIGSALVVNHELVPNTELGHITLPNGKEAEHWASSAVKERKRLSWKQWASRLQDVYSQYEMLLSPDLIIVGGGISKYSEHFLPLLKTRADIVPATLRNSAGIIGAAALGAREASVAQSAKSLGHPLVSHACFSEKNVLFIGRSRLFCSASFPEYRPLVLPRFPRESAISHAFTHVSALPYV